MAIHVYRVLCASAVVLAGAFTATLLVSGGWQASAPRSPSWPALPSSRR